MRKRFRDPFQFHLSTALIVIFAAAGILWLNVRPVYHCYEFYTNSPHAPFATMEIFEQGWPIMCRTFWPEPILAQYGAWHLKNALINIAIAAALLFGTGVVAEMCVRHFRRSNKNSAQTPS